MNSKRGGKRPNSGAKPKDGVARKSFNCRLHPDTITWIEGERGRTGKSAGEIVDRAIEVLQALPEEQFSEVHSQDD